MVTFEAGRLVADRFRLEKPLGRGGMGEVWRAHHVTLDMPCAIKFIIEDADDATQRARFQREARAAAKLRSPYVVQMLDHGVWEDTPYIAMELLEGETLEERLDRVGRLASGQVITLFSDVAQALDKARDLGIVHRDLKPGNLFIVQGGKREVVKVLDFGVAKPMKEGELERLTAVGALVGTPGYMAPEQLRGDDVGPAADLFSLGMTMARLLSGERFVGETLLEVIRAHMEAGPIPVPHSVRISELGPVVRRALQRDPAHRFPSARAMLAALDGAMASDTRGPTSASGTVLLPEHLDNDAAPNSTLPLDHMPWLRDDER